MKAFVTNGSSLLGASLIRALRWEGHEVFTVVSSTARADWLDGDAGVHRIDKAALPTRHYLAVLRAEDVVFDTTPGSISVTSAGKLARFDTGVMIGPGEGEQSELGQWIEEFLVSRRVRRSNGGARVSDARDVALAMVEAAETRRRGSFAVAGPYVEFEQILAQLEWITGVSARGGGSVELTSSTSEISSDIFRVSSRPLQETLADIVAWHEVRQRAVAKVA